MAANRVACIKRLRQAAGGDLPDDELEALLKRVRNRTNANAVTLPSLNQAIEQAVKEVAEELRIEVMVQKRNAINNARIRMRTYDWAKRNFGTNVLDALESLLVGANYNVQGSRNSASLAQDALRAKYNAGAEADMRKAGVWELFRRGPLERDTYIARRALGTPNEKALLKTLDPRAVEIARVMNKWGDVARLEANDAGANIGKLEGRGDRQTHDMMKIRKDSAEWHDMANREFDIPRMMAETGADSPRELLDSLYDALSSGEHSKPLANSLAFKPAASIASRLSKSRVIHFKTPEGAWAYQQRFGYGTVQESFFAELDRMATGTGLMKTLGTSPRQTVEWLKAKLIKDAKEAKDLASIDRIKGSKRLDWYMDELDGTTSIPADGILARIGSVARGIANITKLGFILPTQLSDLGTAGRAVTYQGRSFFSGLSEGLNGLFTRIDDQGERQDLLLALEVMLESHQGKMAQAGGNLLEPGAMARTQQAFFKITGSRAATERLRAAAAEGTSHWLALQSRNDYANISPALRADLNKHGITEREWDILRQAKQMAVNNKEFMTPEGVRAVPDAVAQKYAQDTLNDDLAALQTRIDDVTNRVNDLKAKLGSLQAAGASQKETFRTRESLKSQGGALYNLQRAHKQATTRGVQPSDLDTARNTVADKLRGYILDSNDYAILRPTAKVRGLLHAGQQAGTYPGEAIRFLAQFKSFPVAFMQRVTGRDIYGRGFKGGGFFGKNGAAMNALANGNGELTALAQSMITATLFGYASLTVSDLLRGKTPRDISTPEGAYKTFLASFAKGGAIGPYTDFLFGEQSAFSGTVHTLAGPVIGTAGDVIDLAASAVQGKGSANKALSLVQHNIPFNTLYTKTLLDYLFFNGVHEEISPGYLRRMERKAKKERGQEYLISPRESVRY